MNASAPDEGRLRGSGAARRLTHRLLESIPGIAHGFTVRGSALATAVADAAGRAIPVHTARQVHGDRVLEIGTLGPPACPPPEGDALLTALPDVALAVGVADCVPVLLADPVAGVVAAAHAGWRGTVAGVLPRAIAGCVDRGARPGNLRVVLGPHIGRCCFEVGPEVVEAFRRALPDDAAVVVEAAPRARIDLLAANRAQALASGVPAASIGAVGLCTVCRPDLLESYRRSGGAPGRMAGFIARIA